MPPLSLTQSKYAFAAFGMSVKSVPGCLVAMRPGLLGSPPASWPLPRPHFDAATAGLAGAAVVLAPPPVDVDELSLPPQAATTSRHTASASSASAGRILVQRNILL